MPPKHLSEMKCGNELHAGDTSQSTRTCEEHCCGTPTGVGSCGTG